MATATAKKKPIDKSKNPIPSLDNPDAPTRTVNGLLVVNPETVEAKDIIGIDKIRPGGTPPTDPGAALVNENKEDAETKAAKGAKAPESGKPAKKETTGTAAKNDAGQGEKTKPEGEGLKDDPKE